MERTCWKSIQMKLHVKFKKKTESHKSKLLSIMFQKDITIAACLWNLRYGSFRVSEHGRIRPVIMLLPISVQLHV